MRTKNIGPSPSGKATDFDSVIRGFESRRPSQQKGTFAGALLLAGKDGGIL